MLFDRAVVTGNVTMVGTLGHQNQWTVAGDVLENQAVESQVALNWSENPTWGGINHHLEPDRRLALQAGSFGTLVLKSRAELELGPGKYFVDSLEMHSGSTLRLSSATEPTILYVRHGVTFRGQIIGEQAPKRFLIVSLTAGQIEIDAPFVGSVFAPHASVRLSPVNGSGHTGSFFGNVLEAGARNPIHFVAFEHWSEVFPQVCDGAADWTNSADEANCPVFSCSPGVTVLTTRKCDGHYHCANGADEHGCPGEVTCSDGRRVPLARVCDGIENCADGADEDACEMQACGDGNSVPKSLACNGVRDCENGSDEAGCDAFQCLDGKRSVPAKWTCDGVLNCLDGSDERNCEGFFACTDNLWEVPRANRCDGIVHCKNGSDEASCVGYRSCADNKMGIPPAQWCDGFPQCLDASDEREPGCMQYIY